MHRPLTVLTLAASGDRAAALRSHARSSFRCAVAGVAATMVLAFAGCNATTDATAAPTSPSTGDTTALGDNASLLGRLPFRADNAWNTRIDTASVDPNSANLIASIGLGTGLHPDFGTIYGIPYRIVSGTTTPRAIAFSVADESDAGPYPIPLDAPVEGGATSTGDRHVLVIDRDHWKLYELYAAYPNAPSGTWSAYSGAVFDLGSNTLRPAGWTSSDAAGLPVFPGLARYDEVVTQGVIRHALRFTVRRSRHAYVSPARHFASSDTSSNRPPMGMRVRLKAAFDISTFPPSTRVILQALKTYGMIVADNGSDWYITGAPDARWNDGDLNAIKSVTGSNFEVVKMGTVVTR
jgi:hypothetical protein